MQNEQRLPALAAIQIHGGSGGDFGDTVARWERRAIHQGRPVTLPKYWSMASPLASLLSPSMLFASQNEL